MPLPSCTVALTYFERSTPHFSYFCTSSPQGWTVQPNGTIQPPSRSRLVEIRLTSFPGGASFAGFQATGGVETGWPPNASPWSTEAELESLGIFVPAQEAWPPPAGAIALTLDFRGVANSVVFYRLAVEGTNGVEWDDPRVYNDPDE